MPQLIRLGRLIRPEGVRGLYLIAPGFIAPAFTFSRAQAGGAQSTATASDAATVEYYAADIPRFNGAARRLLIEGQRTNSVLHSSDTTQWALFSGAGSTSNTSTAPDGTVTADLVTLGNSGSQVFRNGLSTGTGVHAISAWLKSGLLRLSVVDGGDRLSADLTIGAAFTRSSYNYTVVTSINQASYYGPAVGSPSQMTVWGFQLEAGSFPSTHIPTTSAALTRGRDVAPALLSALGISGAMTITGVAMIPQNAPTGIQQVILSVDDGADSNRFTLRNSPAGAVIQALRVTAGVAAVSTDLGSMTAGTAFRYALILNGDGTGSALLEGGAWQAIAGGPTGVTTLRLGSTVAAGNEMFGEHGRMNATAGALSQSAAAARMAAIPLT